MELPPRFVRQDYMHNAMAGKTQVPVLSDVNVTGVLLFANISKPLQLSSPSWSSRHKAVAAAENNTAAAATIDKVITLGLDVRVQAFNGA